jgi:hypothetical protein
MVAGN